MDGLTRILIWCIVIGFFATVFGSVQCVSGHNFAVAAQHEFTAVGRITGFGRHGAFMYKFPVNGVMRDDYSAVCRTPLAPGACRLNGSVLVYYSFQPFSNSRLEDFAAASAHAYRIGEPALAIGLPLFVWSTVITVILSRKNNSKRHPDPGDQKGRSKSGEVPDVIHIVPGE